MRDLSLHLMDLIENSTRAGAGVVAVTIETDKNSDRLILTIEDDGPGIAVSSDVATDPFYTTVGRKKTGLGLSLMRATTEAAGGGLTLGRSSLGGALVVAAMQRSHVDRPPMGDVTMTLAAVACTHPQLDLRVTLRNGTDCETLRRPPVPADDALANAQAFGQQANKTLNRLWPDSL